MMSSGARSEVVAVVTGASRGAGKGIALALGQTGATVYVTGRSAQRDDSSYGGTVGETAALIDEVGGTGVVVVLDHADDAAVAALFERIAREHGRLDILVNNAANFAGAGEAWRFLEQPLELADLITVGLRSHFVAAYHAAPLLIANGRGLIVNTGYYGAVSYHQGPAYGAQKAGAEREVGLGRALCRTLPVDQVRAVRGQDHVVGMQVQVQEGGTSTERRPQPAKDGHGMHQGVQVSQEPGVMAQGPWPAREHLEHG
ncbi:MAG TPA: SDR family NAD(P)-dependent oxidoreductase, partial [Streptosporangiaceae bacterium]